MSSDNYKLKIFELRISVISRFIVLFLWSAAFSQDQDLSVYFKKFDSTQGLSNNDVFAIHKDILGLVWIGTRAGINRFDGRVFDVPLGGNSKPVHRIEEDTEGFLWLIETFEAKINNIKSVSFLDIFSKKIISPEERFQEVPFDWNQLQVLRKNKFGTFFLGLKSGEIFTFHPDSGFQRIPFESEDFLLRDFDFHNKDQFWVLSVAHAKQLSKWVLINLKGEIISEKVLNYLVGWRKIGRDENQNLWYLNVKLKTQGSILSFDSLGNFQKYPLNVIAPEIPDSLILYWIDWVEFSPDKKYVFTNFHRKAKLYNRQNQKLIYDFSQLPEFKNQIWRKPYYDSNGDIWMPCSNGFFIVKMEGNKFSHFLSDGDFTPSCRGICAVNDTTLIANTYKGTYLLDPRKPLYYKKFEKIKDIAIPALKDRQGNIWLGAAEKIFFWDAKKDTVAEISLRISTFFDHIRSLIELPDGRIGFAGTRSIGYIETESKRVFMNYAKRDSSDNKFFGRFSDDFLANLKIYSIRADRQGNLWCLSNRGLFFFDFEKGFQEVFNENQTNENYLPAKDFRDLYQDKEGIYWVATGVGGLIRWNKTKREFNQFSDGNGLNTNSFYAILEDDFGNIWASSDRGIIQFNKKTASGIAWLPASGTTAEEFNWGSNFKAPDGSLYFGSLDGITKFHPKDFLLEQRGLPDVKMNIIDFEKFENLTGKFENKTQEILKEQKIILFPDDGNFRLRFLADDYFNQEQIFYSSQIEGLDNEPTESKSNELKFGRLPFGNYSLRIKGKLPNGQFSKNELNIPIVVIRDNSFKQWQLFLFVEILFLLFVWGYRRYFSSKKIASESEEKHDSNNKKAMPMTLDVEQIWLKKLEEITAKNLTDFNLSVDTLAIEMNMGRTAFYARVKELTGKSPKLYLQEMRLQLAKHYLETGQKRSVKATAYSVGIKDVKYFSRIFKKRFDILPSKLLSPK